MAPHLNCRRWLVGLSGGMDSVVLLHIVRTYIDQLSIAPELCALHINHGISPHANTWREHCASYCAMLKIPLISEHVVVQKAKRTSLETCARKARYLAFGKHVQRGDCLLLAHHADDQMETLLLRLNRGAGTLGLSAIASERSIGEAQLIRPLLHWTRKQIQEYAKTHQLHWIEDESNTDLNMDRNFLRHKVLPLLESRWNGYRQAWQRAIYLVRESAALNDELARLDWEANNDSHLKQSYLKSIGAARCANLLRYRLRLLKIEPPNKTRLQEFIRQLYEGSEKARPELCWRGGTMRLHAKKIEISATDLS